MESGVEPLQALLGRSVSKRLGNNVSLSLHLEAVIADSARLSDQHRNTALQAGE